MCIYVHIYLVATVQPAQAAAAAAAAAVNIKSMSLVAFFITHTQRGRCSLCVCRAVPCSVV